MDFSIVIVNWNTGHLLMDCLESIYRQSNPARFEVIVVDNASSDDSCRLVTARFPLVRLVSNRENVGFSRANNQGILQSRGQYVLLLNPDTLFLSDAPAKFKEIFEQYPDVGIVGGQLITPDQQPQRWTRGKTLSLRTAFNHYLFLSGLFPGSRFFSGLVDNRAYRSLAEMDWVSGACLAVRRCVLDEVGLLDESIFMYNEDAELCYRVKQAGYRVMYEPAARVQHFISQSLQQQTDEWVLDAPLTSQDRFYQRLHGRRGLFWFRLVVCLGTSLRFIIHAMMYVLRPTAGQRSRMRLARRHAVLALRLLLSAPSQGTQS